MQTLFEHDPDAGVRSWRKLGSAVAPDVGRGQVVDDRSEKGSCHLPATGVSDDTCKRRAETVDVDRRAPESGGGASESRYRCCRGGGHLARTDGDA
jgi:hypothetical protein